jgi:hypothetical protein
MILLFYYWIRKSSKLFILLLALALNPVLVLSQFGNLEFIFVKDFRFQTFFLKITNPGKKFDFFAQKCKNLGFERFLSPLL